jgi:hypothetical protein
LFFHYPDPALSPSLAWYLTRHNHDSAGPSID